SAALGKILDAIVRSTNPDVLRTRAVVAALAARLEPGAAAAGVEEALQAMTNRIRPIALKALEATVEALASRMEPRAAAAAATKAIDAMARTADVRVRESLHHSVQALTAQAALEGLVDLLKQPTSVSEARRAILRELGQRESCKFEELWDAVDWLRDHE